MTSLGFWALTFFVMTVVGGTGWLVKTFAGKVLSKLDELIESIQNLSIQNQNHNDRLKVLDETVKEHRERLNKHGDKIHQIDLKLAKDK